MEDVWNRVSHFYSILGFSLVCGIKMEYVWNMYGISMEYAWNVYKIICMEYRKNMYGTVYVGFHTFMGNILGTCMAYV